MLRCLVLLLCAGLLAAPAAGAEDSAYVPAELQDWIGWVLEKHPDGGCPFQADGQYRICDAASSLRLTLDDSGGTFELVGRTFREGQVTLPGNATHWPQDVALDAKPHPVVEHDTKPVAWLPQGPYSLSGRFRWNSLPDILAIPAGTALIALSVNGEARPRVARPQSDRIWVGRTAAEGAGAESDRLSLTVFRRIEDAVPMQVTTLYRIEAAGAQREVRLPSPLLEGFTPLQVYSALPVRLDRDGLFQLQVRPGLWEVAVTGRSDAPRSRLTAPAFPDAEHWPEAETWVFQARPELRLVEIGGAPSIDPTQVPLPRGWSGLPTYRLMPGGALAFDVKRRGDPEPEPNQLRIERSLWLDFDGRGYTMRDHITGTLSRGWRLDSLPATKPGYVELDGSPQLITRLSEDGPAGVELRQGRVQLVAESRIARDAGELSAIGWDHTFQSVSAQLNLPPGWKVFSVSGADNIPGSWLQRWTLFDLFLVLITSVAAARLWNWRWGAVFLVTLTLLWHETGAPQWTWINLIAAIALLRVTGDVKRLRRSLEIYRAITALVLVLLLIPFSVAQIRIAIYPQLEYPGRPIEGHEVPLSAPSAPEAAKTGQAMREALDSGTLESREGKAIGLPEANRYPLASVDPKAKLQTGPGLPQWQWNAIQLAWNGPVEPQQTVDIVYLSPAVNALLNWLRVALALLLAWRLIRASVPAKAGAALPVLGAMTLLPLVMLAQPRDAHAGYPPAELLNELEQRLLEAPRCLPECAAVPRGSLVVTADDLLQLRLDIHVAQTVGIPLPGRAGHWEPDLVAVDGELPPLARAGDGTLHVVLQEGVHTLVMRGTLAGTSTVELHFPLLPKRLDVDVAGWDVSGFLEPGRPGRQLQLNRLAPDRRDEVAWDPVTVPPFVTLDKIFRIGLDWEVAYRVTRVTPPGKSVVLRVPLHGGETVLSEGVHIGDGFAEVTLGPEQSLFEWRSRLNKSSSLQLQAADNDLWTEVWHFEVSPIWHVDYQGIAPIHHISRDNRWLPTWHPWPGESLTASISRPQGLPGNTVTIQSSSLAVQPGQRATDAQLNLTVRSSQGTRRSIRIPAGAELLSVTIDGTSQPIRQEGGEVIIPLRPGTQGVELAWRSADQVDTFTATPPIDLGGPHVNASLQMSLGRDRWILWASGPAMGPAVLFWGVLIVIVLVAGMLGRLKQTPLNTLQWALLGAGLSQVPLPFAAVVVAWFFVMAYRGRGRLPEGALQFNAMQVGLALMTLFVVGAVVAAVQKGLLGWPSMLITGNQSGAYLLNWYQDRWGEGFPQASVVSVPLIVYRLLMLAWALWLAFSGVSWLRWGWRQYSVGGLYRPWQRRSGQGGRSQAGSGETSGKAPQDPWTGQ